MIYSVTITTNYDNGVESEATIRVTLPQLEAAIQVLLLIPDVTSLVVVIGKPAQ